MKFKIRFASQLVGAFVVLALVFSVLVVVFMGINQRWFSRNYHYYTRFESGKGLSVGMGISFKGFEIGKVTSVRLTEDNRVEVEFYIQDTYLAKVYRNSVLQHASNPLGLGGGLVFHQGSEATDPIPELSFIPSLDSDEGQYLRDQGKVAVGKEDDAINRLLGSVEPILINTNKIIVSANELIITINSSLKGSNPGPLGVTMRNIAGSTASLPETMQKVNALVAEFNTIAANLAIMSAKFQDPRGIVKLLLDPKGSLATLLDDDNVLFKEIASIIGSLRATVKQLSDFAVFVNSTQPQLIGILEKGQATLDQARDALEGIKNHPVFSGGVTTQALQPTTVKSLRDEDF